MATPPSGAENGAASKIAKDRNCPFCGQSFTSSSLGRHLDLYIKPKNPKPADGVHIVDEIRKLRGHITRRQSRIASVKRDGSTPAGSGPASARYGLEKNATSSSFKLNELSWETTGVMNDLPPRTEPRPSSTRDLGKKDRLKADLAQRQKLTDELDTGRAAQMALKELIETIREAESSTTGGDLYDFDFFQSSFATLVLRILPPPPSLTSTSPIISTQSWSSSVPWEEQRDALIRDVETRGKVARQATQWLNSTERPSERHLDSFYKHIAHTFDLWKNLSNSNRKDIWQREILRGYARLDVDLKDAYNTIKSLKREIEHLSGRLDKLHSNSNVYPNSWQERYNNPYAPLTTFNISHDMLRQLCKQGLDLRGWDYERLVNKWKAVVKSERIAVDGLEAQRALSTSSQYPHRAEAGKGPEHSRSRSASVASAMSVAEPTTAKSTDSVSQEVDADGEEDETTGDAYRQGNHVAHDHEHAQAASVSQTNGDYTRSRDTSPYATNPYAQSPSTATPGRSPFASSFRWPHAQTKPPMQAPAACSTPATRDGPTKRLLPGPHSWLAEIHQAATHSMEVMEGPAAGAAPMR